MLCLGTPISASNKIDEYPTPTRADSMSGPSDQHRLGSQRRRPDFKEQVGLLRRYERYMFSNGAWAARRHCSYNGKANGLSALLTTSVTWTGWAEHHLQGALLDPHNWHVFVNTRSTTRTSAAASQPMLQYRNYQPESATGCRQRRRPPCCPGSN